MLGKSTKNLVWMLLSLWLVAPAAWCDEAAADPVSNKTSYEKPHVAPRVCHGRMLTANWGPCVRGSWPEWLVRGYDYPERISL